MKKEEKKEKELSFDEKVSLQYELIELASRATGRSTHILNEIINDFFENPIGTPIEIYDHYEYKGYDKDKKRIVCNTKARENMLNMVRKRLASEHPNIEYSVEHNSGTIYIYRKTQKRREANMGRIKEIQHLLEYDKIKVSDSE